MSKNSIDPRTESKSIGLQVLDPELNHKYGRTESIRPNEIELIRFSVFCAPLVFRGLTGTTLG